VCECGRLQEYLVPLSEWRETAASVYVERSRTACSSESKEYVIDLSYYYVMLLTERAETPN